MLLKFISHCMIQCKYDWKKIIIYLYFAFFIAFQSYQPYQSSFNSDIRYQKFLYTQWKYFGKPIILWWQAKCEWRMRSVSIVILMLIQSCFYASKDLPTWLGHRYFPFSLMSTLTTMNILNWDVRKRKSIQTITHDNSKFCLSYNEHN